MCHANRLVETHHSWYGGSPREPSLPTGTEIPIDARILSIADAYDAIVSDRVYRKGRSQEEAFAELRRCAGVQFDPDLVEPFIECVLSRDDNRESLSPKVSKQTALNIGLQIESLAYSVDQEDNAGLANFAGVLKETAIERGVVGIAELAEELEAAANGDAEQLDLVQLTNQLLELCRATQTAYLSEEDSDPLVHEQGRASTLNWRRPKSWRLLTSVESPSVTYGNRPRACPDAFGRGFWTAGDSLRARTRIASLSMVTKRPSSNCPNPTARRILFVRVDQSPTRETFETTEHRLQTGQFSRILLTPLAAC